MNLLAVLDANVTGVLYLLAIALFVIAALLVLTEHRVAGFALGLVALGLALVWFPACWNAFAA